MRDGGRQRERGFRCLSLWLPLSLVTLSLVLVASLYLVVSLLSLTPLPVSLSLSLPLSLSLSLSLSHSLFLSTLVASLPPPSRCCLAFVASLTHSLPPSLSRGVYFSSSPSAPSQVSHKPFVPFSLLLALTLSLPLSLVVEPSPRGLGPARKEE